MQHQQHNSFRHVMQVNVHWAPQCCWRNVWPIGTGMHTNWCGLNIGQALTQYIELVSKELQAVGANDTYKLRSLLICGSHSSSAG